MELSPRGDIARVRAVVDDGYRLVLDYPNGTTATVDAQTPWELDVGQVLLVSAAENRLEPLPSDMWPEDDWVATVRLRLQDITIVDNGSTFRTIPTNDLAYDAGNTVLCRGGIGVTRVLSTNPIRLFEPSGLGPDPAARFRTLASDEGPGFADFGGYEQIVERAHELISLPLLHNEELAKIGARPIKGVLFTGDPGTGKTFLAQVIAHEAQATYYEINGPQINSKWVGETEELLRKIFDDAAKHQPSIIIFDEIDSVAPARDGAHEHSRQLVGQLLTLMDGFKRNTRVVVIATTNRPDDLDPALRRSGRFDWEIHFPQPSERDREAILRIREAPLNALGPMPHAVIAERTEGWSSADLVQIFSEAALFAIKDGRDVIMASDYEAGFARVEQQRRDRFARDTARLLAASSV